MKESKILLRDSQRRAKKVSSDEVGLVASSCALCTKRLWGKTNYSNGPQCLYLPCKWCIQRIATGLCGRLSAHPCPSPQERNRNTYCADRSIEIDEISIRRKCTGILFFVAANYHLVDFDYIISESDEYETITKV